MIIAKFYRGQFDGEQLVLPAPYQRFVIPKFGTITIEFFYLRADQLDENMWAYLYEGL